LVRERITAAFIVPDQLQSFVMVQSRRFQVAMGIYVVLAMLAWFLMSSERIPIGNGGISFRGLTLALLGFFAARTVLHWRAEKIRAESEQQ
jgi:hypothetical protein